MPAFRCPNHISGRVGVNASGTQAERWRFDSLLYIYTVQCKVFRLNSRGVPLPESSRTEQSKIGRLHLKARSTRHPEQRSVFMAMLLEPSRENPILPPLDDAVVVRISDRGMLIRGTEVIAHGPANKQTFTRHAQEWVCKPVGQASDA